MKKIKFLRKNEKIQLKDMIVQNNRVHKNKRKD